MLFGEKFGELILHTGTEIILTLLCPFDYTAFAVSGKVGIP